METYLFETRRRSFDERGTAERVNEVNIAHVEKMRVLNIIEGVRAHERAKAKSRKRGRMSPGIVEDVVL